MSNQNLGKPTMSVSEARESLGRSRATVIRYLRRGSLEGFQVNPGEANSWWRVYVHSVNELVAAREGEIE